MKTLLILFAIMYIIGEVVSFAGYWTYNHLTSEQLERVSGTQTLNLLSTCSQFKNWRDYIKWGILGAPIRFVLSPLSMLIVIMIMFELRHNLDVL